MMEYVRKTQGDDIGRFWANDPNPDPAITEIIETEPYTGSFIVPRLSSDGTFYEGATSEQKLARIEEIKEETRLLLLKTDWYVTRFAERQIPVPPEVTAERTAILDSCDSRIAEIENS